MAEPISGTVVFWNEIKGYGFIRPDDGGPDVFVHISALERSGLLGLSENQSVWFEIEKNQTGRTVATNILVVPGTGTDDPGPSSPK